MLVHACPRSAFGRSTYRLCDVVDYNCTVRIAVVHRRKGLVSFLARGVPYLKLHCCLFVEGNGLSEESGADSGFSVVVELVLLLTVRDQMGTLGVGEGGLSHLDKAEHQG